MNEREPSIPVQWEDGVAAVAVEVVGYGRELDVHGDAVGHGVLFDLCPSAAKS